MSHKVKNRIQATLEVLIILLLLVGGASLFFADPIVAAEGPVVAVLGSMYAAFFYGTVFVGEALWLTFTKVFKKKYARKYALFTIYITLLFTIMLEIVLTGWSVAVIDNALATLAAGWCWLNWKMRIEYLDPSTFAKDIDGLRDDGPPSLRYKE